MSVIIETPVPLPLQHHGRLVAILAMIGSAACWGGATVMSRDLLTQIQAPTLLVIQLAASVTVLLLMAAPLRPLRYANAKLLKVSLTGILEPGLAYSFGLWGLSLTSAGNASIIGSMEPVFIVLLAWLLSGGRPSRKLLLCVGIAMAGLLLVSEDALAGGGVGSLAGNLLIVLATLFAASYVVLSARFACNYPAAVLAGGQQLVGLGCALAIYLAGRLSGMLGPESNELTLRIVAYAAASGVVQYAMAFWLYLIGLRYLSAGAAGLWLTLIPVFGVSGAYLWLHEVPTVTMLTGMGLIIGAVCLGRREQ
jgi:drug/metabolite transporter (DMT)-like permease